MHSNARRILTCLLLATLFMIDYSRLGTTLRSARTVQVHRAVLTAAQQPARPPLVVAYYAERNLYAWKTLLTESRRLSWIITTNYSFVDLRGNLRGSHDPTVVTMTHRLGSKVQFRVANLAGGGFDRDIAHAILTQPAPHARALASVLRVLDVHNYDGVNLDFENVSPKDRNALTLFATKLSTAVRSRGKTLSIAVPGTTSDQPDNNWSGAFDLVALGRVSDAIIVMAYDEHWSTSSPGPVAALPWVEAVVQHTARQVGREKLLLGVAFYGYDWPKRGYAEGVSMREAVSRATIARTPILWDTRGHVPYYKTAHRTVYFEDAYSIEAKLTLATRQRLAGIAAWRLGHELPEVWDLLATYQQDPQALTSRNLTRKASASRKPTAMLPELLRLPLVR